MLMQGVFKDNIQRSYSWRGTFRKNSIILGCLALEVRCIDVCFLILQQRVQGLNVNTRSLSLYTLSKGIPHISERVLSIIDRRGFEVLYHLRNISFEPIGTTRILLYRGMSLSTDIVLDDPHSFNAFPPFPSTTLPN